MAPSTAIPLIAQLKTALRNVKSREEWAEIITEFSGLQQLATIQYGLFMGGAVSSVRPVGPTPVQSNVSDINRNRNRRSRARVVKTA